MSFEMPEQTPITRICNTSVYDGTLAVKRETDIKVLYHARMYESLNLKRATLLKAIASRIRKLEAK